MLSQGHKLIIVVLSSVTNKPARMAIRDTWGASASSLGVNVFFFLGTTLNEQIQLDIEEENDEYGDLLQCSVIDQYYNLTLKSLAMMNWVASQCSSGPVKFVLKIDEDMILNINSLLNFTKTIENRSRLMVGKLGHRLRPFRNIKSKYYVSEEVFSESIYPDFLAGPGYLFTVDVARLLYTTAMEDNKQLFLEDVYLTGMVAQRSHITRMHNPMMHNTHVPVNSCNFPSLITSHKYTPHAIRATWESVHATPCKRTNG